MGVVGLPLTQGGEVANQVVQRDQGVLRVWGEFLGRSWGDQVGSLNWGGFGGQSQGVGIPVSS